MPDLRARCSRLLESSDERLRKSRELAAKSHSHVCRTQDLVVRSKALLTRNVALVQQLITDNSTSENLSPLLDESPVGDLLQVISGQNIQGEVVNMDGKHFIDCEIADCTLQYSGMPVIIESTHFSGCRFRFTGEAALTMRFLECFELMSEGGPKYALSLGSLPSQRPN